MTGQATEQERHFFTTELEVMKMLPAHPNVLQLVGSYTTNGRYWGGGRDAANGHEHWCSQSSGGGGGGGFLLGCKDL